MKCIAKRARERDETKMCGRRQTKSNVYVWIIVYVGRSRKMCSMAARSNNVSFYAEESCRPKRVSLWGRMFIAIEKKTAATTYKENRGRCGTQWDLPWWFIAMRYVDLSDCRCIEDFLSAS